MQIEKCKLKSQTEKCRALWHMVTAVIGHLEHGNWNWKMVPETRSIDSWLLNPDF